MYDQTLRYVHKMAIRNKRYEQRLVSDLRSVLRKEKVPEFEILLIEGLAPQSAFEFGMVIETIEQHLLSAPDDGFLVN